MPVVNVLGIVASSPLSLLPVGRTGAMRPVVMVDVGEDVVVVGLAVGD